MSLVWIIRKLWTEMVSVLGTRKCTCGCKWLLISFITTARTICDTFVNLELHYPYQREEKMIPKSMLAAHRFTLEFYSGQRRNKAIKQNERQRSSMSHSPCYLSKSPVIDYEGFYTLSVSRSQANYENPPFYFKMQQSYLSKVTLRARKHGYR